MKEKMFKYAKNLQFEEAKKEVLKNSTQGEDAEDVSFDDLFG